jgi:hypothetical protein
MEELSKSPAELEIERLCAALEPSFQVRLGESVRAKATFFDTFEWGVWFGERLLASLSGGQLRLCERDHDWIGDLRHAIPASARKVQRFVWELPEGGYGAANWIVSWASDVSSASRASRFVSGRLIC